MDTILPPHSPFFKMTAYSACVAVVTTVALSNSSKFTTPFLMALRKLTQKKPTMCPLRL
jgi:hypothetical protein